MALRKGAASVTSAVTRGQKVQSQKPSNLKPQPNQTFAVTDGRDAVGTVAAINGVFVAINTTTSEVVGSFDTLTAVAREGARTAIFRKECNAR